MTYHIGCSTCKNLQIHRYLRFLPPTLSMPSSQASRGRKAVPDHMNKIAWAGAPKKGLVESDHFPREVADHLNSCMVRCGKIARTRTCGHDGHVHWCIWGFGSESDDCVDPALNQVIEFLVGIWILERFFRLTRITSIFIFIYSRANTSALVACTTSKNPRHSLILFLYEWRGRPDRLKRTTKKNHDIPVEANVQRINKVIYDFWY